MYGVLWGIYHVIIVIIVVEQRASHFPHGHFLMENKTTRRFEWLQSQGIEIQTQRSTEEVRPLRWRWWGWSPEGRRCPRSSGSSTPGQWEGCGWHFQMQPRSAEVKGQSLREIPNLQKKEAWRLKGAEKVCESKSIRRLLGPVLLLPSLNIHFC